MTYLICAMLLSHAPLQLCPADITKTSAGAVIWRCLVGVVAGLTALTLVVSAAEIVCTFICRKRYPCYAEYRFEADLDSLQVEINADHEVGDALEFVDTNALTAANEPEFVQLTPQNWERFARLRHKIVRPQGDEMVKYVVMVEERRKYMSRYALPESAKTAMESEIQEYEEALAQANQDAIKRLQTTGLSELQSKAVHKLMTNLPREVKKFARPICENGLTMPRLRQLSQREAAALATTLGLNMMQTNALHRLHSGTRLNAVVRFGSAGHLMRLRVADCVLPLLCLTVRSIIGTSCCNWWYYRQY